LKSLAIDLQGSIGWKDCLQLEKKSFSEDVGNKKEGFFHSFAWKFLKQESS